MKNNIYIFFEATIIFVLILITTQKKSRCIMYPDSGGQINGEVRFEQENENSPVNIQLKVYGASSVHGFHVHEKGSIEDGCISSGAHYNPFNMTHGGPESDVRHMGDLGNILTKDNNSITYNFVNDKISLFGPYSIEGRTCVVHAKQDDLGLKKNDPESLKTGNAGARLACGIIKSYNPILQFFFGVSLLIIGAIFILWYFLCFKKSSPISNETVRNENEHA